MQRKLIGMVLGFSLMGSILAQNRPQPLLDGLESKIDQQVRKYLDLDIFSGVVLVAQEGQPLYHKPFGLANRQKNQANTMETKFDIGSMNKDFTKVLILQLLENKKLKLSDKLGKFLDGFPEEVAASVEVSHLLNHTSGFGDYLESPDFFDAPPEEKTIVRLVERIRQMPVYFAPGEDQVYSNSGYILLGAIIEKVAGTSYHDLVISEILEPLGMNDTYVRDKYNVPDRAVGYLKDMKGAIEDNSGFVDIPNPDGGFQSTTADIVKFYREFHYGEQILRKKTKMKDEFYRLVQDHHHSGGAIPHAGGFNGANTVIYEILRDRISIVVFANMDEPVAEQLGADILSLIRGQEPDEPQLPAIQLVYQALTGQGVDYVKSNFENLSTNFHPTDPKSMILNMIGYELMRDEELGRANQAFKLNTELFPEDPNVWDSYGECLLNQGHKDKALEMYRKALSIDPEFPSALKMVKELNP